MILPELECRHQSDHSNYRMYKIIDLNPITSEIRKSQDILIEIGKFLTQERLMMVKSI